MSFTGRISGIAAQSAARNTLPWGSRRFRTAPAARRGSAGVRAVCGWTLLAMWAGGMMSTAAHAAEPAASGGAKIVPQATMIGEPVGYLTKMNDTLLDIARRYDAGYVEILIANAGVDPWLPGPGKLIVTPTQHLVPRVQPVGIVINLPELRLYFFPPGHTNAPISFPIGIGDEGKETPVGRTEVQRKNPRPSWTPTRSEHEENSELPTTVNPGPDNPMGDYALYLRWSGYAIHGTNQPYSIGRRDSHGCIRMYPDDIATLFRLVKVGTPVTVINEPAKAGWIGDTLYLEVHPNTADIDPIEQGEMVTHQLTPDVEAAVAAAVAEASGKATAIVDPAAVFTAAIERTGLPVVVGRVAPLADDSAPLSPSTATPDAVGR